MVLILVDLFPFKQIYQSADGVTTNRAWSGQAFQKNKEKKKDTKKSKAGDRLCPTKLKSGTSYGPVWFALVHLTLRGNLVCIQY